MSDIIHGEWLGADAPANYRITLPDGEQKLVDRVRVSGQRLNVTGGFEMRCAEWDIGGDGTLRIEP